MSDIQNPQSEAELSDRDLEQAAGGAATTSGCVEPIKQPTKQPFELTALTQSPGTVHDSGASSVASQ